MKKILIVVAHHDDEILGCGGTVNKLVKNGYNAYSLILGEGPFSRYSREDRVKAKEEYITLDEQAIKANSIIKVREVFFKKFPDNRFDSINLLDIVKAIEELKQKIEPDIIFTHFEKDLNNDHQITYKAVITASRPIINESVKEIYSFSVLSSTEWSFPLRFSPDVFFDITETINCKIKAFKEYKSELREFPHPRSLKGIKTNAKYWGMTVGLRFAEAFKCVRIIQ